jgi:Zn-finger nucleic acid-binding protein
MFTSPHPELQMDCPKCKNPLVNGLLSDLLLTKHCHECQGDWISGRNYQMWKSERQETKFENFSFGENYDLPHPTNPLDSKAATCPECGRIMSRGKVGLKQPFYIEHCQGCDGFWCDAGEWAVLEQLDLHSHLEQLFSTAWQAQVRANHMLDLERQAVINKVGAELAQKVFDLAESLEKEQNGDFAAAYLMRRFDKISNQVKNK